MCVYLCPIPLMIILHESWDKFLGIELVSFGNPRIHHFMGDVLHQDGGELVEQFNVVLK